MSMYKQIVKLTEEGLKPKEIAKRTKAKISYIYFVRNEVKKAGKKKPSKIVKAVKEMKTTLDALDKIKDKPETTRMSQEDLRRPTPNRIFQLKRAVELGFQTSDINEVCGIDPWFIEQIKLIVDIEYKLRKELNKKTLLMAKQNGFSDEHISLITGVSGPVEFDDNGDPSVATMGVYEYTANDKFAPAADQFITGAVPAQQ